MTHFYYYFYIKLIQALSSHPKQEVRNVISVVFSVLLSRVLQESKGIT